MHTRAPTHKCTHAPNLAHAPTRVGNLVFGGQGDDAHFYRWGASDAVADFVDSSRSTPTGALAKAEALAAQLTAPIVEALQLEGSTALGATPTSPRTQRVPTQSGRTSRSGRGMSVEVRAMSASATKWL